MAANLPEPTLHLVIDVKPFTELTDYDSNGSTSSTLTMMMNTNLQQSIGAGQKYVQNKLPGLIMNQMEKTLSIVTRALNFVDDPNLIQIQRPPLSDNEFRYYCDSVGQIIHQMELRKVIFSGGIDPSLRRVVWKHILNVYPFGLTGKERMDYIKRKSSEYYRMREVWRTAVMEQGNAVSGELAYVTSMVRKDVLRTDRHHPFYAGNDDNQNIGALFNVLTTYALNHPEVSYCQGMSDMASPLLVTMCDEAQAYICFCGLMSRMKYNFMIDGIAMTKKFAHLSEALRFYDIEFYNYLKHQQADDLLFCYRWLLLEMKREFAFEDSLRMLEIMWASLPIDQPDKELQLFEKEFVVPAPKSPSLIITESPYTKICALRRQNSAMSISSHQTNDQPKLDFTKRLNQSLDETKRESNRRNVRKAHQSLDESKLSLLRQKSFTIGDISPSEEVDAEKRADSSIEDISEEKNPFLYSDSTDVDLPTGSDNSTEVKTITRGNSVTETLKELKEKLTASKIGLANAIEKLEEDYDPLNAPLPEVRLVKNFSEFLNFVKRSNSEEEKQDEQLTIDSKNENKEKTEVSPENSQDYYPMTTSVTRGLKIELDNLNRQVFGPNCSQLTEDHLEKSQLNDSHPPYTKLDHQMSSIDTIEVDTGQAYESVKPKTLKRELNDEPANNRISVASSTNMDVFIWQNPLHASSDWLKVRARSSNNLATTPDEQADIEFDSVIEMEHGKKSVTPIRLLRKYCETGKSNRNSTVDPDSDSEESDNNKWNVRLNVNNPFFEQIQQLNATQPDIPEEPQMTTSCEEASELQATVLNSENIEIVKQEVFPSTSESVPSIPLELPPPGDFGNGNPFLMFLCLTLLLQHRDIVMRNGMDYNEMAMHFDKMVRKHNVIKVLSQARRLYQDYLRYHNEKTKNSNNTKI
jgi:TBC1 domain family member 25